MEENKTPIKIDKFELIIFCVLFSLLGLGCGFILQNWVNEKTSNINQAEALYCNSNDFYNSSICINNYVQSIYKYNHTDDDKQLTIEELKERGGDCYDWSKFYKSELEKKGFKTQLITLSINQTVNHVIAIANDGNKYCIYDQRLILCN